MFRKLVDIFVADRHNPVKLEGVETWMVEWKARTGSYSSDTRSVCQAFTNKPDAQEFAASLRQAFDLVRNSCERYSINVERVK